MRRKRPKKTKWKIAASAAPVLLIIFLILSVVGVLGVIYDAAKDMLHKTIAYIEYVFPTTFSDQRKMSEFRTMHSDINTLSAMDLLFLLDNSGLSDGQKKELTSQFTQNAISYDDFRYLLSAVSSYEPGQGDYISGIRQSKSITRKMSVEDYVNYLERVQGYVDAVADPTDEQQAAIDDAWEAYRTSSGEPASTMTTLSIKITWLLTARANAISCVTTTMVMRSSASCRITFSTSPVSSGSRALVGSSKYKISGSRAKARAIATRCC